MYTQVRQPTTKMYFTLQPFHWMNFQGNSGWPFHHTREIAIFSGISYPCLGVELSKLTPVLAWSSVHFLRRKIASKVKQTWGGGGVRILQELPGVEFPRNWLGCVKRFLHIIVCLMNGKKRPAGKIRGNAMFTCGDLLPIYMFSSHSARW